MQVNVYPQIAEMAEDVASRGKKAINDAIAERGHANVIVATGTSQYEVLDSLIKNGGIDWSVVTIFHLDEYCGISVEHKASFRKYLKERVADQLPTLKEFVYIEGDVDDLEAEISRLSTKINQHPIDVAFIGIGENGHIAFNEPPANLDTTDPYIIVELDDTSRNQQVGEGWFATFDDVPANAISMSIHYILKSALILCTVPDERKAETVKNAIEGPMEPSCPATYLRTHKNVSLHMDEPAASQLLYREMYN